MRLFEGIEAEGILRGLPTLFVAGDVPFATIAPHLEESFYAQIYFGADLLSFVNWHTVRATIGKLRLCVNPMLVTVECDKVDSNLFEFLALDRFRLVLSFSATAVYGALLDHPDWDEFARKIQIKVDTANYSCLWPLHQVFKNKRSDIKSDRELWRGPDAA